MNKLKNTKGVALLVSITVMLFLSMIASALFIRLFSEYKNSQAEKDSIDAFYHAEEGINYAYGELSLSDYKWLTHDWSGNPLSLNPVTSSTYQVQMGGSINSSGIYSVSGHHFNVVVFPEIDSGGNETGVIIIHSQGKSPTGRISRTLELRISKNSLFEYFYFFPNSTTFDTATFDGSGYGKIHVNGAITFKGSPVFKNLLELSTANAANNGYFQIYNSQYTSPYYYDKNYGTTAIDGVIPMIQNTAPPFDFSFPSDFRYGIISKFNWGTNAKFEGTNWGTGMLPSELDRTWQWDKYSGEKDSKEKTVSVRITNSDLAGKAFSQGNPSAGTQKTYLLSQAEYDTFISDPSAFNWEAWKQTNGFTDANTATTGNLAKRFIRAWYNLNDTGNWIADAPSDVNHEWWDDLVYGNDRTGSDIIDVKYFNTKEQSSEWNTWLQDKQVSITQTDTNQTQTMPLSDILKDGSNGGTYMVPLKLESNYKKKSEEGGILLTKGQTAEYTAWANTPYSITLSNGETINFTINSVGEIWDQMYYRYEAGEISDDLFNEFDMRVNDALSEAYNNVPPYWDWNIPEELTACGAVTFTEFFNPLRHPGVSEYYWSSPRFNDVNNMKYARKTKVIDIDVEKLRTYLEDNGQEFNGVIYIENPDSNDIYQGDFSVRVKNAGILPENGLTVVTPHNIYVQGSFNLDYSRDKETEAYTSYKQAHGGSDSEYQWRNAALISSQRMIYTVSDNFEDYINSINNLAEISSYNYWKVGENSYPHSLKSQYFLDTYLTQKGITPSSDSLPQTVKNFLTKYNITLPSSWTVDNIKQIFNPELYPEAGACQSALLNAGETNYDLATESTQPNRVDHDVIYNTAVVTPYDPRGYTLERWISQDGQQKTRNITGAFIQLEDIYRGWVPLSYSIKNKDNIWTYAAEPGYDTYGYYHYGYYAHGYLPHYSPYNYPTGTSQGYYLYPKYNYAYETNFATSGSTGSGNPMATAVGSWIEIPNTDFLPDS